MIQKEIWNKIARNEPLSEEERFSFTEFGNRLQRMESLVSGWTSSQGGVQQSAISFPFFPLIQSETFVEDKAEYIVEVPESYNHLLIMGMVKTTGGANTLIKAQVNGDTGANYSVQRMSSAAAVVSSAGGTTETALHIGPVVDSGADAGEGGFFVVFMPSYKSALYKSTVSIEGTFRLAAPNASSNALFASQWRNDDVLKKLRFFLLSGNIKAGSLISVYGIS